MSDLKNLVYQCIEEWMAGRYTERHGLVTSYDPQNYLAKVTFQPDGQESGWLPIETGHIGDGYGIAVGLEPGDGKTTGDQVIVRYQEGDFESGKVVQRVHSEKDKAPVVQSGEMVLWTRWGQKIFFAKDGSLLLTDAAGTTVLLDGKGDLNETATTLNETCTNINETASNQIESYAKNANKVESDKLVHLGTKGGNDSAVTTAAGPSDVVKATTA